MGGRFLPKKLIRQLEGAPRIQEELQVMGALRKPPTRVLVGLGHWEGSGVHWVCGRVRLSHVVFMLHLSSTQSTCSMNFSEATEGEQLLIDWDSGLSLGGHTVSLEFYEECQSLWHCFLPFPSALFWSRCLWRMK